MNEQPNITADTRDRVLKAIERLGYRPNPAARRLASGKSHLIGLFHSLCTPPDAALVEQITLEMASERYRVLVCAADCRSPAAVEEISALARVVPIDGAILCAPLSEQSAFGPAFHAQKIPCVRIGATGLHGVCADDRGAARQVTQYLTSLGHARIGFIGGSKDDESAQARRLGFFDGMQIAALAVDPDMLMAGEDTYEFGVACGRRMLLEGGRPPSAIFASTDIVAAGVLSAAHEIGIPVPERLSVFGFGDRPIARQIWPSLSTVRPPSHPLAARAATLLLGLLNGGGADEDQPAMLPAEIVLRNSTGVRSA